jgi:hypothetical protein
MKLQAFQRQMLLESLIINVGFLKLCLQLGDRSIYVRDTEWTFLLLCSRLPFAGPDFIKAYLIDQFEFLAANVQKIVQPEQVTEAKAILAEAVVTAQKSDYKTLSHDYLAQGAYPEIKQQYLQHLLDRDIRSAQKCLDEALSKLPFFQVYTDFIQNVMYQVGELWQRNKITVAQEHYCTAATQMIMAQLYPVLFDRPQNGKKVVVSCVGQRAARDGRPHAFRFIYLRRLGQHLFRSGGAPGFPAANFAERAAGAVRAGGVHGPEYSFVRGYGSLFEEKFTPAAGSGRRLCV